jgi:hypothetical protein
LRLPLRQAVHLTQGEALIVRQANDEFFQRMSTLHITRAVGSCDAQRRRRRQSSLLLRWLNGRCLDEEGKQIKRVGSGPLQVVEDQQGSSRTGHIRQIPTRGGEDEAPLLAGSE